MLGKVRCRVNTPSHGSAALLARFHVFKCSSRPSSANSTCCTGRAGSTCSTISAGYKSTSSTSTIGIVLLALVVLLVLVVLAVLFVPLVLTVPLVLVVLDIEEAFTQTFSDCSLLDSRWILAQMPEFQ